MAARPETMKPLGRGARLWGSITVLSAMTLLASPAGAELSKEWRWCGGKDQPSIELVIKSCTHVIKSAREPPEHLATAFYNRATAHRIQAWNDPPIQHPHEPTPLD